MAAISDLSARDGAARFQLFDRQLSAHGARDGRRGGAVDGGTPRHHNAAVVWYRHSAGRAARMAGGATLDALSDAAVMGAACHSVLPAWLDPDVPSGVPGSAAADIRRLQCGREPDAVAGIRVGCGVTRAAAGLVDR